MKHNFYSKIAYDRQLCDFCGACVAVCPHDAIELAEADLSITESCTFCANCVHVCPMRALEIIDAR
ncbi:4Fe-4S binding protein [candidate division KSB1 bacterium]|nr:4Fe-4S binding protein [candidate division KSB1 bacterium]RQW10781.1 MAG: 4Fe-4S dicluster domain-containing protein [candidate division KSB1 bacterium]